MSLRVGDLFNPAIHLKMVSDFDQDRKKPNRATVTRHCEESGSRKIVFYRKKYQQFSEAERRELLILTYAGSLNLKHVVNIRPSFSANDSSKQIIVDTLDAGLRVADWCGIRPIGVTPSRQHCLQEVGQFLRLTQACLLALKELHSHGMRHLDIKFDNICLPYTKNQNNEIEIDFDQVKLIDFDTAIFTRMPLENVLPFSPSSDATNYQSARLKAAIRSKDVKQQDTLGFDVDLYALGYMLNTIMNVSLGYPESLSDADQRSLQKDIESVIDNLLQYDTQHCDTTQIHEQLLLQAEALLRELKSVDGSILRYAFQINPQQVCSWDNRADYASDHVVPIVATDLFSAPPLLSIEPTDMDAPTPPKSISIPIDIKSIRPNPPKSLFKRIVNGFLVLLGVAMLLQIAVLVFWTDKLTADDAAEHAQSDTSSAAEPALDFSTLSYEELRTAVMDSDWLMTGDGEPPAEFDSFLHKNSMLLDSEDRQVMLDRALLLRYGRGVAVDLEQSKALLEQVIKISMTPEFDDHRQMAGQALRDYGFDATWADLGEALTTPNNSRAALGFYNIDFFYCENKRRTSEPVARAAINLKANGYVGNWRVRELSDATNQKEGYGLIKNEIRFTPPDEVAIASAVAQDLALQGVKVALEATLYQTPKYISVFICQ